MVGLCVSVPCYLQGGIADLNFSWHRTRSVALLVSQHLAASKLPMLGYHTLISHIVLGILTYTVSCIISVYLSGWLENQTLIPQNYPHFTLYCQRLWSFYDAATELWCHLDKNLLFVLFSRFNHVMNTVLPTKVWEGEIFSRKLLHLAESITEKINTISVLSAILTAPCVIWRLSIITLSVEWIIHDLTAHVH